MKMNTPIAAALATLLALTAFLITAIAADWTTYGNARYGFSVDYPANLFTQQQASDNGDGITLKSEDGAIEFRAYAFNNGDELSMRDVRDILLQNMDGRSITYKRIKGSWMVISGYERSGGDTRDIFYQRIQSSRDGTRFSVFEIIYPETRRDEVDRLIRRMSLSLTPPRNLSE